MLSKSNCINTSAKEIILLLQNFIAHLGFTPVIHFELEGCYDSEKNDKRVDFTRLNFALKQLNIAGELIPEYWRNQWEYVSLFNGQLPLQEADNLTKVISHLPQLFAQQGIEKTYIKPVVWAGDKGKLAQGSAHIFSVEERDVHIPNAIQMNVSVNNCQGKNIISDSYFGEYLQQCFIETSLGCSLLYLPEEEAFDRFALKSKFGLAQELCSPSDISGGHQGSIALYKQFGKHNQAMGEQAILYDYLDNVIVSESLWQTTARIEHRLGAASVHYNAYVNVIFGLLNIIDALNVYITGGCQVELKRKVQSRVNEMPLPLSLYDSDTGLGAISLFEKDSWFASSITRIENQLVNEQALETQDVNSLFSHNKMMSKNVEYTHLDVTKKAPSLGETLKLAILKHYQRPQIIT